MRGYKRGRKGEIKEVFERDREREVIEGKERYLQQFNYSCSR